MMSSCKIEWNFVLCSYALHLRAAPVCLVHCGSFAMVSHREGLTEFGGEDGWMQTWAEGKSQNSDV